MNRPQFIDVVESYARAVLIGVAALGIMFVAGPWVVLVLSFGMGLKIPVPLAALTPLMLYLMITVAFARRRAIRPRHFAAAVVVGAIAPVGYAVMTLRAFAA